MASWTPDNYYSEVTSTANRTDITTVDEMRPFMPAQAYNAHNVDTGEYDDDTRSETGLSQTSYASSSASTSETNKLHVPNPPNNYDGTEFICQYCFKAVVSLTDRTVWRFVPLKFRCLFFRIIIVMRIIQKTCFPRCTPLRMHLQRLSPGIPYLRKETRLVLPRKTCIKESGSVTFAILASSSPVNASETIF
jgi:hypothetical protein